MKDELAKGIGEKNEAFRYNQRNQIKEKVEGKRERETVLC